MKLFLPITKVDAVQRLVYGTLAAETPDKSGEIFDYASSKPLFQAWSGDFHKATEGKSVGNMRAMHGSVAAGKFTIMDFNDDEKRIDVCGKVVDDAEWAKVEEGVYTGFSIGGKYEKRWKDGDLTRYTAAPVEGSLVDNPCIPTATFSMIKADGSTEMRKFKTIEEPAVPANDQIAAKARELAKAAGDENKWADHIEAASSELVKAGVTTVNEARAANGEEPIAEEALAKTEVEAEPELEQVWKAKDGSTHKKKADAIKHNEDLASKAISLPLTDALAALKSAVDTAEGKPAVEPAAKADKPDKTDADPKDDKDAPGADDKGEAAAGDDKKPDPKGKKKATKPADKAAHVELLRKGLHDVSRLACLIAELDWLQNSLESEAAYEGDNSPLPAALKSNIAALVVTLKALVEEETSELFDDAESAVFVEVLELAAKPLMAKSIEALKALLPEKAAEALAKAGARNSSADSKRIQGMHDASVELGATCGGDADKAAHAHGDELTKVTAERDAMSKAMAETTSAITELTKRIQTLETTPAQSVPARTLVVEKDQDGTGFEDLAKKNPEAAAIALIRAAQQLPQQAFNRGK